MNPGRIALFFIAAMLAGALTLGYWETHPSATFGKGWVATHAIPYGATVVGADVKEIEIAQGGDSYNELTTTPVNMRVSHSISKGHRLDADDFLSARQTVEVPIAFKGAANLGAGDRVDVYVQQGGAVTLVARGALLTSPSVVDVPAQDEAAWLELAASGVALYGTKSSGLDVSVPADGMTLPDAVRRLSTAAQSGAGSPP
jgi:hypothetical protein